LITLLAAFGHVAFDVLFGWTLWSLHRHERSWAETLTLSVLLGIYVETLSVATLMFLGISLRAAGIGTAVAMGVVIISAFYRGGLRYSRPSIERPKWYEWALLAAIGEKIFFVVWQLTRTHAYFDDNLQHWSGRARSLFGGLNWSLDSMSPFFLGGHIGNSSYPLQIVIWRALTAELRGEWNDIISRADGLIFFVVILGTIWLAVRRFSNLRWLAAAAAFVVSAVPLHAWHAAAGYSDIAVEAFAVVSLAALMRGEWFTGGLMAAGAVWSKNDGLVLFFPALLTAVGMLQTRNLAGRFEWRNVGRFLSGFATIAPWLIFNYIHALGITAGQGELNWHSDALALLWNAVMKGPTSSILWIFVFACAIYSWVAMFKDRTGRALILAFSVSLAAIVFIFSSTSAYRFLVDDTTIHRTMMQFSAMAVLVVTYGFWLKTRSVEWSRPLARVRRSKTSGLKRG